MHLDPYVDQVAEQLGAAAALGDDRAKEVAAALAAAAGPAVRLALLAALSAAADEINAALLDAPGAPAVAVRLEGGEAVIETRAGEPAADPAPAEDAHAGDATARISLRLPEALKADIDAAAERDGVSVNTWLVRIASAAVRLRAAGDFAAKWGSAFSAFAADGGADRRGSRPDPRRITGWVNG